MAATDPLAPARFSAAPHLPPPRPPAWKTHGLAALSGLLLVGSFPSLDWGWLVWLALVPFLSTFPHRRLRDAMAHGTTFALVFLGGLCFWLAVFAGQAIGPVLGLVAWLIATLALATPVIAFAAWAHLLRAQRTPWAWRLGVPAVWTLLEWMRQWGPLGTGWGGLAYTQHRMLLILPVTRLGGVWILAFLLVLVNVALTEMLMAGAKKTAPRPGPGFSLAVLGLVAAALGYGGWTVRTERLNPAFRAAALQADISPNVPRLTDAYVGQVMQTYAAQGQEAAARGAILTVWPETVFPGYLRWDPVLRASVSADARRRRQAMVIGGNDRQIGDDKDANVLFLVDAQGQLAGAYTKRQLVPFGEYVPARRWLPFLDSLHLTIIDRQAGRDRQPLLDAGPPIGRIGAAICYESSYGRLTREQVARGAGLLVVSTDDTWFGRTAATEQHAAFAAVRACESDRYLIRCAATGISQIIAPSGQVIREAGLYRRAVLVAPVQARTNLTPYVRWGDWFIGLCGAILTALVVISGRGRRGRIARSWDR